MPKTEATQQRLAERLFYFYLADCISDREDLVQDLKKYTLTHPYAVVYLIGELIGSRNYHGQFIAYRLNKNLGYFWQRSKFGSGSRIYNRLLQCVTMIDSAISMLDDASPLQLAESAYDRGDFKGAVYGFKQCYSTIINSSDKNYLATMLYRAANVYIKQALYDLSSSELKSYLELAKECNQQKEAKKGDDTQIDQGLILKMLELANTLNDLHELIVELQLIFSDQSLPGGYLNESAKHLQSMEVYLLLDFIGREIYHERAGTAAIMADEFCYALSEGFSPVDCLYAIANHLYSPGQNGWRWNQPKMVERQFVAALEHAGRQRSSSRDEAFPVSLARELRVRAFCVIQEWVMKNRFCLAFYDRAHYREMLGALIPEYAQSQSDVGMNLTYYHACCSILNVLNADQLNAIYTAIRRIDNVMRSVSLDNKLQTIKIIPGFMDEFLASFSLDQHRVFNQRIIRRCYLSAVVVLADQYKIREPLLEACPTLNHYVMHHHREPYTRVGSAIKNNAVNDLGLSGEFVESDLGRILFELRQDDSQEVLEGALKKLYNYLNTTIYKLHGGGETVLYSGELIKVPRHVKLMLTSYEDTMSSANSLPGLKALRDKMLGIAAYAADRPPSYFCGLFTPRDQETQSLYEMIRGSARLVSDLNLSA